jgi:predicted transcriptional regulator
MERKVIKARDVMHTKHLELDGMATVHQALEAMRANRASVVIVKKRHENDAFGIVLLSDIAKKVLAQDRSVQRVNVYEIMSKPVLFIRPEMDIRYCARFFGRFGISAAPVISRGEIQGLVSYQHLVLKGICP